MSSESSNNQKNNVIDFLEKRDFGKILRENSLLEPAIRNPFIHDLKPTACQKFQLLIGGIILVPIRLIISSIIVFFAIIVGFIMTIGLNEDDLKQKPLSGWRKRFRGILRFLGRALAFTFGFHSIKKFGKRSTRDECTIFVAAPHTSYFDAFLFFILGLPTAISRAENGSLPIVGRVVRAVQPILVSREDSKNKQSSIQAIKTRADPQSDWSQMLIFPEGTTTNGSCLIYFKPGAFIPKLPIQPVVIKYKNKINTITWTWQGLSAVKVFFLTLCQFNNKMEVHYLPVYQPDDREKLDANYYALNVRNKMAEYLNVLTTNHTYEDCRLMCRAREFNLPFDSAIIEFSHLKDKLGIKYDNAEEMLEKYANFACKNNGKMTLKEFCDYLGLETGDTTMQIFDLYDRNKDGLIDFREFVIGLSLVSRPNSHKNMKLAFEMFGNDQNLINLKDFQSILNSHFSMSKEETAILFEKIDRKKQGYITFDEFYQYASNAPEYSKLFNQLKELKILSSNLEYMELANNMMSSENKKSDVLFVKQTPSNVSLTKRPQSDRSKSNEAKLEDLKPVSNESLNNLLTNTKANEPKNE